MQTFLPYPSYSQSAAVLDMQRLGKQRVETLQILNVLTGNRILNVYGYRDTGRVRKAPVLDDEGNRLYDKDGKAITELKPVIKKYDRPQSDWVLSPTARSWGNHPMTRMWEPYPESLIKYGLVFCDEWVRRGYQDTCAAKMRFLYPHLTDEDIADSEDPSWLGDYDLHRSHQSNLVRKRPDLYRPLFPDVPDDLPYVWPL